MKFKLSKFTQNIKQKYQQSKRALTYAALVTIGSFTAIGARAQLPDAVAPSTGDQGGNYLLFMQGWTGDAINYIALAISGAGFLWIGWILLSKFNEARSSNDPDWGSVGLTAVIAGVLLAVVSFFLNEATGIITTG